MQFADPQNDIAFKKIFGNEHHKDILISFLNAILDFPASHRVVEVSLQTPYQIPKIEDLKETVLDIAAKDVTGREFIVEMQVQSHVNFDKRSLYYTSKSYTAQLGKGHNYALLKKIYFIGILNFVCMKTPHYISTHLILNRETGEQYVKDFSFCFIELPKFKTTLEDITPHNIRDKWIYFLKHAATFDAIPAIYKDNTVFEEACTIAAHSAWNKEELIVYDYIEKKRLDAISLEHQHRKEGREEGEKKGRAEGIKEGEKKGRAEGEKKGRAEGEKKGKRESARNMLREGLSIETVQRVTGLSETEIRSI